MNDMSPTTDRRPMEGATQTDLEHLYSKYQLHKAIAQEFVDAGFPADFEAKEINPHFGIDLLTQMHLHKRANVGVLVGILKHHFEGEENPAQACADEILKCCEHDFADWHSLASQVVVRYEISEDVQDKIDCYQYPLPMIEEPRPVTNNRETGYRTIKRSILLKNNHHDEDICLDHINRMNQIPLALNRSVIAFVQNSWKNLDRKKDDETVEEFQKRQKAFAKYDEVSRDVLDALSLHRDRFWLTHRYDKRGRTYTAGYHVNYQGNTWNKACVEFADAECLNVE